MTQINAEHRTEGYIGYMTQAKLPSGDAAPSHARHLTDAKRAVGVVHAVRGAVVDVVFDAVDLPHLNTALVVQWDRPTPLILEVHSHLDPITLRAVAFQTTAGLAPMAMNGTSVP